MFDKLKSMFGGHKAEPIALGAPVAGEVVPLSEVSDPTFSQEILGKGIAIRPANGRVVSPVDGEIALMFDTGHAVSINADCGAEVLVHVGLDTVGLKGKHFTVHCSNGDKVRKGDLLIEFDPEGIQADGYDTITPMIVCNVDQFGSFEPKTGFTANELESVILLSNK